MKRWVLIWCLLCLGLGQTSVHASGPGGQNGYYQKAAKGIIGDVFASEVKGFGQTIEEAKIDAFKDALKKVGKALTRHHPPLENFQPSKEDLEKYFLKDPGQAGPDLSESGDVWKTWILSWKPPDWDLLESLDRDAARLQASQHRLVDLSWLLGVLLAGLGAWTLYFRMDEWTQRHYTRWLQVGLTGFFVSMVLAGWWWIRW